MSVQTQTQNQSPKNSIPSQKQKDEELIEMVREAQKMIDKIFGEDE